MVQNERFHNEEEEEGGYEAEYYTTNFPGSFTPSIIEANVGSQVTLHWRTVAKN